MEHGRVEDLKGNINTKLVVNFWLSFFCFWQCLITIFFLSKKIKLRMLLSAVAHSDKNMHTTNYY